MLKSLNHITLAVSNIDHSFQFYVDILGFTPEAKWATGAYLSLGDLWLCLSLDDVQQSNDYTHYAFTIEKDDISTFRAKLKARNIAKWKENISEGDSIYFLDPDGHKLEAHVGNLQSRLKTCSSEPYDNMVFFDSDNTKPTK